ncbi:MAG: amino acid adenylation domain-containing protein, partial [bacterium]|nr:amino acid adenylation domain-containing protein [bacterium]
MCEPLSITGLFENQVKTPPDRIAVVCTSGAALTYRGVKKNADLSARYLIENSGVRRGDPVGIMVDRGERMVIGVMAILKAGGAYVPIDPQSPPERIKYILADSNCKALVTENKTIETVKKVTEKPVLNLQNLNQTVNRHPLPALNGKSPAYILYTSGSTGKPKGVLMDHGPLVNLIQWMNTQCPMAEKDVVLLQNPFTFDMSIWGLFAWSFYGAAVYLLAPGDETEPKHILNALQKHNVTVLHFVPSVLSVFLDYLDLLPHVPKVPALKNIFASGEVLSITLVKTFNRVFRASGGISLYNLYGPTETHVATYFNCPAPGSPGSVPIGKPISNTSIYILSKDSRELLPTGAVGEIYIGGACLARGYLNQPELTAEKFGRGAPPHSTPPLYRTGDLGRLSADGNIEFLGRMDDQVKIRGFRVELGEIEYRLLKHPEIKEAVVTAQDGYGGDKFICAYLVAERSAQGTGRVERLREFLA